MQDHAFDLLRVILLVVYWLAICGSVFLLARALILLWRQVTAPAVVWRFQLQEMLESSLLSAVVIAWLSLPVMGIAHDAGYNEKLVVHHLSVLLALSLAAACLLFTGRKTQQSLHANRRLSALTSVTWRITLSFGVAASLGLVLLALPSEIIGELPRKVVSAQSAYAFPKLLGAVALLVALISFAVSDRWIAHQLALRFR